MKKPFQTGEETPGNMGVREGEPAQPFEGNRGEGAATRTVGTGASTWFTRFSDAVANLESRAEEEKKRREEEEAKRKAEEDARRKAKKGKALAKAKGKAA
jgi:hypothetical protein